MCNSSFYFLLSLSQAVLAALARTHLLFFPFCIAFSLLTKMQRPFFWCCYLSNSKVQQHLLFTHIKAITRKRNSSPQVLISILHQV